MSKFIIASISKANEEIMFFTSVQINKESFNSSFNYSKNISDALIFEDIETAESMVSVLKGFCWNAKKFDFALLRK